MKLRCPGALSIQDLAELDGEELRKRIAAGWLMPIAGGAGDDDDDDSSDDTVDLDDDDSDTDTNNDDDSNDGGDDDDDDSQTATISMADFNRLKRKAAEADKARRAAEKEARQQQEREKRESGQWQELIDERDERIRETESERDEARYALAEYQREVRVSRAATRLGFRDPADAVRFLPKDETDDDPSTERSLKRLAKEKPYLVEQRRSTGVAVNGESGTGLSLEEIRKMSPEQVNERWDEVQRSMAAGGRQQ